MQAREKPSEIITAVILALASLLAAWNAYEASAWGSEQATMAQVVSRKRLEATRGLTGAGQLQNRDELAWDRWLVAGRAGDQKLAQYYRARFWNEFKPAFDAWLKLDPQNNPNTPAPFDLPEYAPAALAEAAANEASDRFQHANDRSTSYVRDTLFTAMALFLGALAGRFDYRPVRIAMLALATVMLVIGTVNAARLPII